MSTNAFASMLQRYQQISKSLKRDSDGNNIVKLITSEHTDSKDPNVGLLIIRIVNLDLISTREEVYASFLNDFLRVNGCHDEDFTNFAIDLIDLTSLQIQLPFTSLSSFLFASRLFLKKTIFHCEGFSIVLKKVIRLSHCNTILRPSTIPPVVDGTVTTTATWAVVVAKYNESVEWIPEHWHAHVYLYNKGRTMDKRDTGSFKYYTELRNVGRESHTYLQHIINNYDNLPDITYFTQGHPFDHSPAFIEAVNGSIGVVKPFMMLGKEILSISDHDVSFYEDGFPGIQEGFNRTFAAVYRRKTRQPVIKFSPGGIFSVQKKEIREHCKEYYENALSLLDYDVCPIEGYSFERLWALVFE